MKEGDRIKYKNNFYTVKGFKYVKRVYISELTGRIDRCYAACSNLEEAINNGAILTEIKILVEESNIEIPLNKRE